MNWMNLHHLKYFLTIVEEGSLTGASKKLLVGQPALSAQLKQFENWLGAELFKREGKKLVITPTGEYVLKYAKAIKGLEDELVNNLNHASDFQVKELILGAQESVPKSVLADTISKLRKLRPIHLKVIEGTGETLFNLLTTGKIDVFIGNFRPMSSHKEMLYKSLRKEDVYVWGTKDKLRLKKSFPHSLDSEEFILSGFQNQLRHDFEKFMLESGLSFHLTVEAQDTALQKELASRGEGLLLLGEESAKTWVYSNKLFKLGRVPGLKEEYWLGMIKRDLDNQYIKEVMSAF